MTADRRADAWAPFRNAEIQVSIRKKVARTVLLVPGRKSVAMDFQLGDDVEEFARTGGEIVAKIIAAAGVSCLLGAHSVTVIVDVDSGPIL